MFLEWTSFSLMASLLSSMMPVVIIALIVALIVRLTRGKKTEYGYVKPGEVLMDDAQPTRNNSTGLNIVLYAGSFFIVGSIFLLTREEPSLVPIITIIITLLTYSAGLLLYKFVDYLKPVAIAFTYTAAALFPFWYYAFHEIGLDSSVSILLSTSISLIAYIAASIILESRILGWLSYLWLLFFGWSIGSTIDSGLPADSQKFETYSFFVWSSFVGIVANACWSNRVKWLPIPFRKATQVFAQILVPAATVLAALTVFVPSMASSYPFLRPAVAFLAVISGLISWFVKKNRINIVALRIYLQMLIIFIFMDAFNYSLLSSNPASADLTMTLVWLTTFLIQTLCSLFIKIRNESEKITERSMLAFSLAGIAATTLFCLHFEPTNRAISLIMVAVVVAILGIMIAFRFKNLNWGIATIIALGFIPLELGLDVATPIWGGWVFFTIYAIMAAVYIALYGLSAIIQKQPKQCLNLVVAGLVTCNIVTIIASGTEGWAAAGLLNLGVDLALVALIAKRYGMLEASVYCAAVASVSLINHYAIENHTSINMGLSILQTNIIALPILGFGFFKERKQVAGPRLIIGFIILALAMLSTTGINSLEEKQSDLWALIYILECVALIFAGALTSRKWMAIASMVIAILVALELTGGLNSIWLLIIGIAMVTSVVVYLIYNNGKKSGDKQ